MEGEEDRGQTPLQASPSKLLEKPLLQTTPIIKTQLIK